MTAIDAVIGMLLVMGAMWGMLRGGLLQLAGVALFAASIAVPWFLAGRVAHAFQPVLKESYRFTFTVTVIGLLLMVHVIGLLTTAGLRRARANQKKTEKATKKPAQHSVVRALDRSLGALLGTARIGAVVWVMLSILALFEAPLRANGYAVRTGKSDFYKLSVEHNAMTMLMGAEIKRFHDEVGRVSLAMKSPKAAEILNDPRIKSINAREDVRRALANGDPRALIESSDVLSALTDPDLVDRLDAAAR